MSDHSNSDVSPGHQSMYNTSFRRNDGGEVYLEDDESDPTVSFNNGELYEPSIFSLTIYQNNHVGN